MNDNSCNASHGYFCPGDTSLHSEYLHPICAWCAGPVVVCRDRRDAGTQKTEPAA